MFNICIIVSYNMCINDTNHIHDSITYDLYVLHYYQ